MKAVLRTGSKQYIVAQGDNIVVEKLEGEPGTKVSFDEVLLIENDDQTIVTGVEVAGKYLVTGTIKDQGKGPKLMVYKKRRRKGYERRNGHRQKLTTVAIDSIRTKEA